MTLPIPKAARDITPEWLTAAFAAGGKLGGDKVASVTSQRFGEGFGVVAELSRLTLSYADHPARGPKTIVAKLPIAHAPMRKLAGDYRFYEREVRFYQSIAPTISLSVPQCFYADFDAASGNFVILMEDLAPAIGGDQLGGLPLDQVKIAISSIADLHARWWDRPELRTHSIFPSINRAPYDAIEGIHRASWPKADEFFATRYSKALRHAAERLCTRIHELQDALAAEPRTLVHADFRADNLMFCNGPSGPTMTVIDWQFAFQGRGTFDVGYLMAGHVSTPLRRAHDATLLRDYHAKLCRLGVANYDFDECLLDYRRAMLYSLTYLVQGIANVDLSIPRNLALIESWGQRVEAAIEDWDLGALLG